MVLVMTIKLVSSHYNVVSTSISMVCPCGCCDGCDASVMLLITIILVISAIVVTLEVAMEDAYAQSNHTIV